MLKCLKKNSNERSGEYSGYEKVSYPKSVSFCYDIKLCHEAKLVVVDWPVPFTFWFTEPVFHQIPSSKFTP